MIRKLLLSFLFLLVPLFGFSQTLTGRDYTVGGSGSDFPTLAAAITRINADGISGAVTLLLNENQTLASQIVINQFSGSSATNTLTIKPNDGKTITISGGQVWTNTSLIKLNGADYVIIDGSNTKNGITRNLTIKSTVATDNNNESIIWIASSSNANGANYNTIKNTNITGSLITPSNENSTCLNGILSSSSSDNTKEEDSPNIYNTFINNSFSSVRNGINIKGNKNSTSKNLTISNNTFGGTGKEITLNGIIIDNAQSFTISKNTLDGFLRSDNSTFIYGINIKGKSSIGSIIQNKISNIKTVQSGARGIFLDLDNSVTADITVANNFVSAIWTSSINNRDDYNNAGHGIYINNGKKINIYYNTVSLNMTQNVLSASLFIADGSSLDIRNNILSNSQTSGYRYALYTRTNKNAFSLIKYNNYITSSGGKIGHIEGPGSDSSTIADWKTSTGQDTGSLSVTPIFSSDLFLAAGNLVNESLKGDHTISPITDDIQGEARTKPYMGADEIFVCTSPSITQQPLTPNATCSGSGEQILAVTATGSPTLTYTWKKGGVTITNSTIYSGQGTNTLKLTNATTAENDSYTVVISNGCGTDATSTPVNITVNPALTPIVKITSDIDTTQKFCQGAEVWFYANPTNGGTLPKYQWYRGTTPIANQTDYRILFSNLKDGEKVSVKMISNAPCAPSSEVTSNEIQVSVYMTDRGRTHGGDYICLGETSPLLRVENDEGPNKDKLYEPASKIIHWEYSIDNNQTWTKIEGTEGKTTYRPPNLTVTTTFRAVAQTTTPILCKVLEASIETKITVNIQVSIPSQSTGGQTRCDTTPFNPISVNAAGSPTYGKTELTYQWYKNTSNNNSGGTSLGTANGAQTNTYTPQLGAPETTAYYYCVVTGYCGSVSSSVSGAFVTSVYPNTPAATVTTHPTCFGTKGTITITPSSGLTYSINGTDYYNQSVFSSLEPGTYIVTAKNSLGCVSTTGTQLQLSTPISKIWTGQNSAEWNLANNWSPSGIPTATDCVIIPTGVPNNPVISDVTSNFYANTLTVNNKASLLVKPSNTLTVVNGINVLFDATDGTTGILKFENKSSLMQTNDDPSINSGKISYERITLPIRRADYVYWSSPVKGQTLAGVSNLTGSSFYYAYNGSNWVSTAKTSTMTVGKGYIIRGPETYSNAERKIYPATFNGTPNNGTLPGETVVANKFYLIGNPYPSAMDAEAFILANKLILEGSLYFWTHNTPVVLGGAYDYASDDYATYNLSGSVKTMTAAPSGVKDHDNYNVQPSGKIGAGQSFFANTKAPGSIIFNNSMRRGGNENGQFFKPGNTAKATVLEKNRIWLNMTNAGGVFKQLLVGYIEGATNEYEGAFDGETFDGNKYLDFYSVNNERKLVIQGRSLPFSEKDTVPLGYRSTLVGDFTISIDQADGSMNTQVVYLEDKTTGKIHDLTTANYTFTTEKGTFNDRFVLRYTNKTLGTGDFENVENGLLVAVNDKTIEVNSAKETIKEVTVFDISGRLLYNKKKVGSTELEISNLQSANQVLLVKVVLENDYVATKKIIFN